MMKTYLNYISLCSLRHFFVSFVVKTFIFFVLISFTFCTPKPIDINLKPFEQKLVVASQIIPGKIMIVSLTRSFSALSSATQNDTVPKNFLDSLLVKNALVTVSYSGKTDTLFMATPGVYYSLNTLQNSYDVYTLYVKDRETGQEVTAVTTLLPQVKFDTITPVIIKNPSDTTVKIKYAFTDPPGVSNWYVVNYYKKVTDTSGIDIGNYFVKGNQNVFFELFSDKTFEKSTFERELELPVSRKDTIAVIVSNISEGYFQFLTAFKRTASFVNQLTGEPINYPSNVNGGYGYFTAHYPDVRYFYLKDY